MSDLPSWVNVVAAWWTVLMWLLGALLATFGLVLACQAAAWKIYKELHGWPTIIKAMKAYHNSGEDAP